MGQLNVLQGHKANKNELGGGPPLLGVGCWLLGVQSQRRSAKGEQVTGLFRWAGDQSAFSVDDSGRRERLTIRRLSALCRKRCRKLCRFSNLFPIDDNGWTITVDETFFNAQQPTPNFQQPTISQCDAACSRNITHEDMKARTMRRHEQCHKHRQECLCYLPARRCLRH